MNKERYNQIIDEVYENYINITQKEANDLSEYGDRVNYRPYSKEQFINECKSNPGFSEHWGLKIEEREILKQIDQTNPMLKGSTTLVPTKLITLTYNNETIESYE